MSWSGPERNILIVFVEPRPSDYLAVSIDGESSLFVAVDEDDRETGEAVGAEIIGFLDFDQWDELPDLDLLWQVGDQEPLPLDELLKRKQRELVERTA